MATGYNRGFSKINGDDIIASDFNDEFQALEDAFAITTGHNHDGTLAGGAFIPVLSDNDNYNAIELDTTNNEIDFAVEVATSKAVQMVLKDGALIPQVDDDIDLGGVSNEFKNLYIDGIANIDSLIADTADINAGTVDAVIGGTTPQAGTFTAIVGTSANITGNITLTGTVDTVDVAGLKSDYDAHIADSLDAHDASAISSIVSGNLTSVNVQAALYELQTDIDNVDTGSLTDVVITTPADNEVLAYNFGTSQWFNQTPDEAGLLSPTNTQTVTNKTLVVANNTVTTAASGNLTSTELNAALAELQGSIDTHLADATDAHDASAISNVASGNLIATDVQSALNELQSDIDTRMIDIINGTGQAIFGTSDLIGAESGAVTIATGDSVLASAHVSNDDLIIENNGPCGITLASPTTAQGTGISWAEPTITDKAYIRYDYLTDEMTHQVNSGIAFAIDSTRRIITGTGSDAVGTTAGGLTVSTGDSGVSSPNPDVSADDLIVESSGNAGVSILSPDLSVGKLTFGSPTQPIGAAINWDYTNSRMRVGTRTAGANLILATADNNSALNITADGLLKVQVVDYETLVVADDDVPNKKFCDDTYEPIDVDILKADTTDNFTVGYTTDIETLASNTITPNFQTENLKTRAVTGNVTINAPTTGNGVAHIKLAADASGPYTVTLGTGVSALGTDIPDLQASTTYILSIIRFGTSDAYVELVEAL